MVLKRTGCGIAELDWVEGECQPDNERGAVEPESRLQLAMEILIARLLSVAD